MEDKDIKCFEKDIEIPEIVRSKADNAFSQIRKEYDMKKNNRRYLHFFKSQAAAAAFAIVIAGAGVTAVAAGVNLWSDGILQNLKATPEQQKALTDKGMAVSSGNKDLSKLAITDNGVTIQPDTVVVDDRAAHVSFQITGASYYDAKAFKTSNIYLDSDKKTSDGLHISSLNTGAGFKDGSKAADKILEYDVDIHMPDNNSLVGNTVHIDLTDLGSCDHNGNFNTSVKGKWDFTIQLPDVSEDKTITVNKKIDGSDFSVDSVKISPLSIKVEYSSEITHKLVPEDQETDDTKAPTLAGIKMKDGTEYTSDILGAGNNGYTSQYGKKAEDSFSFAKVVDTDQVSAILVNSKNGEIAEVPID